MSRSFNTRVTRAKEQERTHLQGEKEARVFGTEQQPGAGWGWGGSLESQRGSFEFAGGNR